MAAAPKVILIVEDDPDLRLFYRQVLRISGYIVAAVEDGIDALRRIEADPPDLVLLDIELPRLSGRDVQEELAAHAGTRNIPILVVTGSDGALNPAAFSCILRKPVTAESLVAAVDECLTRERRRWPPIEAWRRERRTGSYCPFCRARTIACSTTVNPGVSAQQWRCFACHSAWPERRKAS